MAVHWTIHEGDTRTSALTTMYLFHGTIGVGHVLHAMATEDGVHKHLRRAILEKQLRTLACAARPAQRE